jgi:Asp-tRNA(Asn)/Glu-tRNA(Gln) amidotransferase A subunit family amidase
VPLVHRLKQLGALILGKTNMHEIGIGTTGENWSWGHARNPYNASHHTGGSSAGSAAAVASKYKRCVCKISAHITVLNRWSRPCCSVSRW